MANSLRAKISKLRHDGNITDVEYQELIKKLDEHDKQIREEIKKELWELPNEYSEKLWKNAYERGRADTLEICRVLFCKYAKGRDLGEIDRLLKEIEEMK